MADQRALLRDCFDAPGARPVALLIDYDAPSHERRTLARFGQRVVEANNGMYRFLYSIPHRFGELFAALPTREFGWILMGLVNEKHLTPRRRRILMTFLTTLLTVGLLTAAGVLAVTNRDGLEAFNAAVRLGVYSIATSTFLPTPFELELLRAYNRLGPVTTILVAAGSKTIGAWAILLAGDRANDGIQALLARNSFTKMLFDRIMAFMQRFGYFAVFVMFAIPFMSDTLPLVLLAVMKMRKGLFLAVTFVAIAIRSAIYLWIVA